MSGFSFKKAVAFLCVYASLSLIIPLVAQDATQSPVPGAAVAPSVAADESSIVLDQAGAATPAQAKAIGSSIWILVRIVVVLALVCAGIYGVVYVLKRSTRASAGVDPYLKNVATLPLAQNRSVQVVTVGSRALVLGVTEQQINLLTELDDRDLVDAMNLASDKANALPKPDFASLLAKFMPSAGTARKPGSPTQAGAASAAVDGGADESVAGSAAETADFLRRQRERLSAAGGVEAERNGAERREAGSRDDDLRSDNRRTDDRRNDGGLR